MPIPALNPVVVNTALCHGCSKKMRVVVNKFKNGQIVSVYYFCDTCKYGVNESPSRLNGPPTKYDRAEEGKKNPETIVTETVSV